MRRIVLVAASAAALFAGAQYAAAMGGGGGGGYGGGGFSNHPAATFDDYSQAKRLINHQQYAEAIPHLEAALQRHPHDADILNYLGYTHRMVGMTYADAGRDGEFKVSLLYYQQALAIDPNHKGVHEYLGELYLQMHDMASAQKEMDTLATLCPSGCDERDTLAKAMAAAVPAAAPAAIPSAAPGSAAPAKSP
jgi:tetratricopeptide (TPR) repeat protein